MKNVYFSTLLTLILLSSKTGASILPVLSILNSDGTLSLCTGSKGSLDLSGFQVSLDPEFGPVFTPLILPPQWNQLGPGLNTTVYEITLSGSDVYVGGGFLNAGGNQDADYIARWDGCQWHAIAGGLNGDVKAIAFNGNNIYVGGSFSQPFNRITRWDGNQWNAMGPGLPNTVNSIIISAGNIYAGGGVWNTGYVAQWIDNTWELLGPTLDAQVNDMAVNGTILYAGGRFSNVGGNQDADGIMRWENGAWQNLGLGIDAGISIGVFDILFHNNELYAGGDFYSAGGNTHAHSVVKWDGNDWINIGAGLDGYFLGLHTITIFNGSLYASVGAGYTNDDGIYRWDFETEAWEVFQIMELGADDPILVLTSDGSSLFAGSFSGMTIEGINYDCIARWGEPQEYIVTSPDENGLGSLRDIISCAPDGATITFALPPSSQIILTSGEIVIDKNLTLEGPGIADLTISGNNTSRIFHLKPGKTLSIENMTLKNTNSLMNGGAVLAEGNLRLEDLLLENNLENGVPKSFTIANTSLLEILGNVNLKN